MSKHRVQLLAGVHYENVEGVEMEFRPPAVFETDGDLAERWPEKFRRVQEFEVTQGRPVYASTPSATAPTTTPAPATPVPDTGRSLDQLTAKELRAVAEAEEISVPDNASKEQLLAAVKKRSSG